ncbi:RagB/SusD family nutrient uptake outer membrane protein [Myroides pelagicus]|uniref:RagB/SusD family nutrient uptake outer membrane protein n=1 Tax=Myroides pelagicus TaxID=270914 RepID=A0A7K1GPL3_9FLAO|nr:RagB/SusD family nutrient uptake outer membrane protein [Myroides pelagicus]MTH30343.1 RagB/SusD family nutrient uptake outer membrane protein [Myroides pelagicus]
MKTFLLNIYTTCLVVSLTFFLNSCEKLIEIDLPDNQINTEDVFKDITTVKAALSNIYFNAKENPLFRGGINGVGCDFSLYTDELEPIDKNNIFYQNALSASVTPVKDYWMFAYRDLYAINAFLEGLNKSEHLTEQTKSVFIGEALFLRALYYQYLTQLFGEIPYIKSTDYKTNSKTNKLAYEQVLLEIEKDLKESLDYLTYQYRTLDRVYPNKAVAELVLAQNYLLQKKYNLAEEFAQKVINNTQYNIELDIKSVFKKQAKSTLWQFNSSLIDNSKVYLPTKEASTYIIENLVNSSLTISEKLFHSFETNDLRKTHWIGEFSKDNKIYPYCFKYKNKENNTDEYSIVFRLEQAYFTLSEALMYQGKNDRAIEQINLIRSRAALPLIGTIVDTQELVTIMLQESNKEFFCEFGHRFFDLKRNDRLSELSLTKPNWSDVNILFPYPESELLLNPNLLPQNYGY